ncbi:heme peroxidase family protein [Paraburkholderia sp. MMS20-SJTR3]|uniref:Heme peroxidase family protein n=1 Tax=Paraburkholderia sejongensis TaxID=2886946 RepID=A0ABS8K2U4_9BURK|nr:heme peroxidase family protein [Paraburkholderia sp. MMS20-SJTR3]MCC8396223.1 heme peroxidase family protein [Paraburkholderia sp. MMS20-SJTR3]
MTYVSRSSLEEGRFGRMFRWLPRETYKKEDLLRLAKIMIQKETVVFVGDADFPKDVRLSADYQPPTEGPNVAVPFPRPQPDTGELFDTAFGESEPDDENPVIPAGYTYFGQFIDHDLTFDPNSSLQKLNDPEALEDFRTPRFDLDSLYGRGPDDQPYLYQDAPDRGGGIRFRLGRTSNNQDRPGELQRNVDGRALIGDPRNDENAIICQLQAVFLNFHNKVIDTLETARPQFKQDHHACFLEAQRIVRWHYQYIVLNDYLKRVVGEKTWRIVFQGSGNARPHPHLKFYLPKHGRSYMPVEFSVAAFRFGHSMVRPSYALRPGDSNVGGGGKGKPFAREKFNRIPLFFRLDKNEGAETSAATSTETDSGPVRDLHGFGPLPDDWEIDWNMFFAEAALPTMHANGGDELQVVGQDTGHFTQPGYRIDTKLVDPLALLPPSVAKSGNAPDGIPVLAYRNLLRGSQFELPSGQSVARALEADVMTEEKLWGDVKDDVLADPNKNPFAYRAPLWYYILKEAETSNTRNDPGPLRDSRGGHCLGEVGGRIVAEVIVGIALNDHTSYLYQDVNWTPASEAARSGFAPKEPITDMYSLIHWTTGGTMTFKA